MKEVFNGYLKRVVIRITSEKVILLNTATEEEANRRVQEIVQSIQEDDGTPEAGLVGDILTAVDVKTRRISDSKIETVYEWKGEKVNEF